MTYASGADVERKPRPTSTKRKKHGHKTALSEKKDESSDEKENYLSESTRIPATSPRVEKSPPAERSGVSGDLSLHSEEQKPSAQLLSSLTQSERDQTSSSVLNNVSQNGNFSLSESKDQTSDPNLRFLPQASNFPAVSVDEEQRQAQDQNNLLSYESFPAFSVDKEQQQILRQNNFSHSGIFSAFSVDKKNVQIQNENTFSQYRSFRPSSIEDSEEQTKGANKIENFSQPPYIKPETIVNKCLLSQCGSFPMLSGKKGKTPIHRRSSLLQSGSFPISLEQTSAARRNWLPQFGSTAAFPKGDEQTSASHPKGISPAESFPISVFAEEIWAEKLGNLLKSESFASLTEKEQTSASATDLLSSQFVDCPTLCTHAREPLSSIHSPVSHCWSSMTLSTVEANRSFQNASQLSECGSFATTSTEEEDTKWSLLSRFESLVIVSTEERDTSRKSQNHLSEVEDFVARSADGGKRSTPTENQLSEFLQYAILSTDEGEPLTPNLSQLSLCGNCAPTAECKETNFSKNAKDKKKKRRAEVQLLLEYTRDVFTHLCLKEQHVACLQCKASTAGGSKKRTRKIQKCTDEESNNPNQEELGLVLESLGNVMCKRLLCIDRRVLRGVISKSKEGYPLLTEARGRRKKKQTQKRKRRGDLQLLLESSGNLLSQRLRCLKGRTLKSLISTPKAGRKPRTGRDKHPITDNTAKVGTPSKKREHEAEEQPQSSPTDGKVKEVRPKDNTPPKKKVHFNSIVVACSE